MSPEREIDETKGGKPDEKIVEVRDQVLTIDLVPDSFMASIRLRRRSSTHGPFLLDLLIASSHGAGRGRCSGRTPCASCACGSPG